MSLLRRMTSSRVHDAERALRKGDLPRAIALMEAALKKSPDDVKGRRQLADVYAKAGRFDDAVRELLVLAEAFAREGLLLKATNAYKAVLELDPEHEGSQAALVELQGSRTSAIAEPTITDGPPPLPAVEVDESDEVIDADALGAEVVAEGGRDVAHAHAHAHGEDGEDGEVHSVEDAEALIVAEASFGDEHDDEELDRSLLPELPLFADLPVHAFDELVSDLDSWRVPEGAVVVHEGEAGHSCFVLVNGEMRVERRGEPLATLARGDVFGEMALLSDSPRAASVVATSPCELFELKRERVEDLMTRYSSVERVLQRFCRERLLANVLRASIFAGLDERLGREIMRAFRQRRVAMGQRVVAQGDKNRGLAVVLAGELDVSREEAGQARTVAQLREGDVFGEMSLLLGEPSSATVTALAPTTLLTLSRQGFQAFAKRHPVMKKRLENVALERLERLEQQAAPSSTAE